MEKWMEKHKRFCDAGLPMSCAGVKLLLYQIKAGNYSAQSDIPTDLDKNSLKIPRKKTRHPHEEIDSILGEEIDIGDIGSVEASEAWSAHDESD